MRYSHWVMLATLLTAHGWHDAPVTTATPGRDTDPHPDSVLARAAPPPAETRADGSDPAQVYDVRLPYAGGPPDAGTVLVVHGGFWRAAHDRAHVAAQAGWSGPGRVGTSQ